MKLDEYLNSPGALSMTELRLKMRALGYAVKSNAQLRQWRYGYEDRAPSPENCVGLELATDGAISRKELRPNDWWLLWPELDGASIERMKASDDVQPPLGGTSRNTKEARMGAV
jgi:DNA-binding transcriptional regulator YdaS (Cro superfamily)